MEVHAHTHTPRKRWSHYFWEFLMLFLAVFCGFLAEYQLEHLIENQREKKYMRSLISDLKEDTAGITAVIGFNIVKFHGLDTFGVLLNQESLNEEDEKRLYTLNRRYAASVYYMIYNERTMKQLLNSGNLRLIRTELVSDSIMDYYGPYKETLIAQEKALDETSRLALSLSQDIFDKSAYLLNMKPDNSFSVVLQQDKMTLMTREKHVLKKFAQTIATAKDELANYLSMLFEIRLKASNLLLLLEKEYGIK